MIGIYCITNKVNGKKYFGQSINIEERKKDYFNYEQFPNDHLRNAFNKYGKENFDFEIIKCCKEKYLDRFEKLYIRINDTTNREKGYNKESGGNLNKRPSDETRKKMSDTQSGENHHFYGQKHTPETRKQMSESHKGDKNPMWGKNHSEETRKQMSEAHKGENNGRWKNYPRIRKSGKTKNGKQRYKIMYNGKILTRSIYKERLYEKWYAKHPDIELIDETE